MTDRECIDERRYDWRRVEQWENLSTRGYTGNATDDYLYPVADGIMRLYKDHRQGGVPYLHAEINDWRYLAHACQLLDDEYEETR